MGVFLRSFEGTVPGGVVCRLFGYVWGVRFYSQCTSVIRYRLVRFLPWIVKLILKISFRNGCSSTCYFSQKKTILIKKTFLQERLVVFLRYGALVRTALVEQFGQGLQCLSVYKTDRVIL